MYEVQAPHDPGTVQDLSYQQGSQDIWNGIDCQHSLKPHFQGPMPSDGSPCMGCETQQETSCVPCG